MTDKLTRRAPPSSSNLAIEVKAVAPVWCRTNPPAPSGSLKSTAQSQTGRHEPYTSSFSPWKHGFSAGKETNNPQQDHEGHKAVEPQPTRPRPSSSRHRQRLWRAGCPRPRKGFLPAPAASKYSAMNSSYLMRHTSKGVYTSFVCWL